MEGWQTGDLERAAWGGSVYYRGRSSLLHSEKACRERGAFQCFSHSAAGLKVITEFLLMTAQTNETPFSEGSRSRINKCTFKRRKAASSFVRAPDASVGVDQSVETAQPRVDPTFNPPNSYSSKEKAS